MRIFALRDTGDHALPLHRPATGGADRAILLPGPLCDPALGRFLQADTVVPQPGNPQAYNRYAYVYGNPVNYVGPTGHIGDPDRDRTVKGVIDSTRSFNPYHLSSHPRFIPPVIRYIYEEMVRNAQGFEAKLIGVCLLDTGGAFQALNEVAARVFWASMVSDWRINYLIWAMYPGYQGSILAGKWDHKRVLGDESLTPDPQILKDGYSQVSNSQYRADIWSNMHYGYVGAAIGFEEVELINGAGAEQTLSTLASGWLPRHAEAAPTWLAGWDDPSDTASIQLGYALWTDYGTDLYPVDIYLKVQQTSGLVRKP